MTFKLVLPGREVMVHLHDSQTAGHLGVKKTTARVKERSTGGGAAVILESGARSATCVHQDEGHGGPLGHQCRVILWELLLKELCSTSWAPSHRQNGPTSTSLLWHITSQSGLRHMQFRIKLRQQLREYWWMKSCMQHPWDGQNQNHSW